MLSSMTALRWPRQTVTRVLNISFRGNFPLGGDLEDLFQSDTRVWYCRDGMSMFFNLFFDLSRIIS